MLWRLRVPPITDTPARTQPCALEARLLRVTAEGPRAPITGDERNRCVSIFYRDSVDLPVAHGKRSQDDPALRWPGPEGKPQRWANPTSFEAHCSPYG